MPDPERPSGLSALREPAPPQADAVAREVARQVATLREEIGRELTALRERTVDDKAAIVVFSGDLDKVLAGFVIATGAAAAGLETTMYFTFWGLSALKKPGAAGGTKGLKERMFSLMTPASSRQLGTSKLNFLGLGSRMLRSMMKDKGIATLEELMDVARDLGVRFMACTMSMDAMGVTREELLDGLEYGGVAAYMAEAARSRVTLFI
jgi:peroxiredoxin family protein